MLMRLKVWLVFITELICDSACVYFAIQLFKLVLFTALRTLSDASTSLTCNQKLIINSPALCLSGAQSKDSQGVQYTQTCEIDCCGIISDRVSVSDPLFFFFFFVIYTTSMLSQYNNSAWQLKGKPLFPFFSFACVMFLTMNTATNAAYFTNI